MTKAQLREFQDCVVVLGLKDGEILKAKLVFVDLEYEDVTVYILETNRPELYKDSNSAYAVEVADITSVERA